MNREHQPSNRPRGATPSRRGAIVIIAAASLLLVTLAVVAITNPDPHSDADAGAGAGAGRSGDVTIGHIHGIAADPSPAAGGRVLIGAHHGLFAVDPAGHATRVGANDSDVMALTAAAPDQLLASGHPGAADASRPANLGLIASGDGGRTWKTVSLRGAADFHALAHAPGRTWGIESTTGGVLTSADNRTWKTVTGPVTGEPFLDLAVDPANPGKVLATTAGGELVDVTADGDTHIRGDAPQLGYLDWPSPDTLAGIDATGLLHRSTDGGQHWTELGRVTGTPTALSVIDNTWYVATSDGLFRGDLAARAGKGDGNENGSGHGKVTHFLAYTA